MTPAHREPTPGPARSWCAPVGRSAGHASQLHSFVVQARDWLRVDHGYGAARVEEISGGVLDNTAASGDGHVLSLSPADRYLACYGRRRAGP